MGHQAGGHERLFYADHPGDLRPRPNDSRTTRAAQRGMNMATSRFPNQPSSLQRPEPIGDGIALRWNNACLCSIHHRITGLGEADVTQLRRVADRFISLTPRSARVLIFKSP